MNFGVRKSGAKRPKLTLPRFKSARSSWPTVRDLLVGGAIVSVLIAVAQFYIERRQSELDQIAQNRSFAVQSAMALSTQKNLSLPGLKAPGLQLPGIFVEAINIENAQLSGSNFSQACIGAIYGSSPR